MKQFSKNIKIYLLLIIGLVIFSHAVIPHDHHYNANSELEHNHDHENSKSDFHCFFFNDIIKDETVSNVKISGLNIFSISFTLFIEDYDNENFFFQTLFIDKTSYSTNCFTYSKIYPTRGSPLS